MSEVEKWSEVHERAVILNEFFDFLNENKISLCKVEKETEMFCPIFKNRDDIIYEFFDIDPNKLEKERRELLEKAKSLSENKNNEENKK